MQPHRNAHDTKLFCNADFLFCSIRHFPARIRRPTAKIARLTPEEEELVRSQLLLHGFHCLLQHQCRTLIEHFGTPSVIVGVVGRIWLGYIAQWRTQPFHDDPTKRWGETHREILVRRHAPGLNTTYQPGHRQSSPAAAMGAENTSLPSVSKKRTRKEQESQVGVSSSVDVDSSRDVLRLAPGELSMSLSM